MSVQTPQAPRVPHGATQAGHASGKKPAASGAVADDAPGSFSTLMGSLSDSAPVVDVADVASAETAALVEAQGFIENKHLTPVDIAPYAIYNIATGVPPAVVSAPVESALATVAVSAQAGVVRFAEPVDKGARADDFVDTMVMGADALPSHGTLGHQINALLGGRAQPGTPVLSQTQINFSEAQKHTTVVMAAQGVTADVTAIKLLPLPTELLFPVVERPLAKPASSQTGSGFEAAWMGASSSTAGLDPTYSVAQASAVVPDTQVAETVSYWVTRGIQTAELTLDGLGSEPVQVQISLEGDQARIDFRSDQADVRQVLESAAGQLKSLLSSEGLQLVGLSVGSSAQGQAQRDAPAHKATVRQASVQPAEAVAAPTRRPPGAGVGQALDLFV